MAVIRQANLEPLGLPLLRRFLDDLEPGLEGHGYDGRVFGDAPFLVQVGVEACYLGHPAFGRIGVRPFADGRGRHPTEILVRSADPHPIVAFLDDADIHAEDRLGHHVAVGGGAGVHVHDGLGDHSVRCAGYRGAQDRRAKQ